MMKRLANLLQGLSGPAQFLWRERYKAFLALGAAAILFMPSSGLTQFPPQGGGGGPPGGFGGGRGGGFRFDPNEMWNRMSGGKDSITRADVTDPGMQFMFDRTVQRLGITNGTLTKQQYLDASQQFMARMRQGGGGGRQPQGGAGGMGSAPQGGPNPGFQPGGFPPGGFGGGPGFPGGDPAEAMFRQLDKNGDGFLNSDEMPDDLKAVKDQFDANKDGLIDLNEYKQYVQSKMQNGQPGMPFAPQETPPPEEEKKPVVYRVGNLPKELPSWFQQLDRDNDAQIGLYEWKESGRPLEEFLAMDRNQDGYLTVEEVLFYEAKNKKNNGKGGTATASAGVPGGFPQGPPGGFPGQGGAGAPGGIPQIAPPGGGNPPLGIRDAGGGGRRGGGRRGGNGENGGR